MPPPDDFQSAAQALGAHHVECALADFTSLARGKLLATDEWVAQAGCRLPNVLFGMTVTGGWPEHLFGDLMPKGYGDMQLVPDLPTLRARPGRPGEASVICEPSGRWLARSPFHIASRVACATRWAASTSVAAGGCMFSDP